MVVHQERQETRGDDSHSVQMNPKIPHQAGSVKLLVSDGKVTNVSHLEATRHSLHETIPMSNLGSNNDNLQFGFGGGMRLEHSNAKQISSGFIGGDQSTDVDKRSKGHEGMSDSTAVKNFVNASGSNMHMKSLKAIEHTTESDIFLS